MKTLIFLMVLFPAIAFSQRSRPTKSDTIRNVLTNLDLAGENLERYHKQYRTGLHFTLGSLALSGIVFGLGSQDPLNYQSYYTTAAVLSGFSLIGVFLMVDSHRFVKKSSFYLRNAGGQVSLGLTF
jgi:hypothetical protein